MDKISVTQAITLASRALACALKHRDTFTLMHSDRVVDLSLKIGRQLALTEKELDALSIAAQLHDIGKIGIDDSILLKKSAFEPDEWEIMQSHATIGSNIVKCLDFQEANVVSLAIRHHHEKYDGSGYPDRLSGEDIPLLSRIITIADCFDAMTENRPYHSRKTNEEALSILREEEEKFDPLIFSRFLSLQL